MKKIIFAAITFAALSLTSCEKLFNALPINYYYVGDEIVVVDKVYYSEYKLGDNKVGEFIMYSKADHSKSANYISLVDHFGSGDEFDMSDFLGSINGEKNKIVMAGNVVNFSGNLADKYAGPNSVEGKCSFKKTITGTWIAQGKDCYVITKDKDGNEVKVNISFHFAGVSEEAPVTE